jgi:peptidyl-prolyl cis-trans isomerase C
VETTTAMTSYQPVLDAPQASTANQGRRRLFLQFVKRMMREPLVHFLLIGTVLFGAYGWMNGGLNQGSGSKNIELTIDDLRQLEIYFESQWHRPPTEQEFVGLVESKVREEILYREALAMGLDKDDTIVKRRMAQKMEFLAEDVAKAHQPTPKELKTWYQNNSARFALPSRATFRHLYFSPDHRGKQAHDDAVKALEKIAGQPADSKAAAALADPFMFQDYYGDRSPEQLSKEFGPGFARTIFQVKPGAWQGPIESGYGWHLVFVDSFTPGHLPAFEAVEPDVKSAWLADQREQAWHKAYETMRAKYTVSLPAPPKKQPANATRLALPKREIPSSSGEGPQ